MQSIIGSKLMSCFKYIFYIFFFQNSLCLFHNYFGFIFIIKNYRNFLNFSYQDSRNDTFNFDIFYSNFNVIDNCK